AFADERWRYDSPVHRKCSIFGFISPDTPDKAGSLICPYCDASRAEKHSFKPFGTIDVSACCNDLCWIIAALQNIKRCVQYLVYLRNVFRSYALDCDPRREGNVC